MFSFIAKALRKRRARQAGPDARPDNAAPRVSASLDANSEAMRRRFGGSGDFVARPFLICGKREALVCYIDGLAKADAINESLLKPLMIESRLMDGFDPFAIGTADELSNMLLTAGEADTESSLNNVIEACLEGDAAVFVCGMTKAVIFNAKGWEKRSITEPQTDTVIRGPREGFTESMRTNTALLRRRIKAPELRMEQMVVGERTRTNVCVAYIEGLTNPALVTEVRRRLNTINTDGILNSGYIEEFIEDKPLSLFQTINYSEKPDVVAGKLLEGRVAIMVDGTPFVLTAPMLFIENFQTSEDYAVRPWYALLLRVVRLFSFFLSLVTPAFYVAVTTFHHELIPTTLLFTITATSEGLPFPSAIETALMLGAFELIREAGIRLPKPVGQAISIVGALVMGQAATQAGIVGAPVVIIVALTAVASFVSPSAADATAILRWGLLLLASTLGGFGIAMGMMAILVYLGSVKSFSTDYLAPLAPLTPGDLKDTFIRWPLWGMRTRPASLKPQDAIRQNMKMPDFSDDKPKQRG